MIETGDLTNETSTGEGRDGSASRGQRRRWDGRADGWDDEVAPGLEAVINAVLDAAQAQKGAVVVDLGCGTGALTLPLARAGAQVTGVDISPLMIDRLLEKAKSAGLDDLKGIVSSMERFALPPESVDLVVSNYALHHLRDRDKRALVTEIARWLRPGGRLVVGDMMFGRGGSTRDREIIRSKVSLLIRRGPGGWWRLMKNFARYSLRVQERPIAPDAWCRHLESVGFTDVSAVPVVSEAVVVVGVKA